MFHLKVDPRMLQKPCAKGVTEVVVFKRRTVSLTRFGLLTSNLQTGPSRCGGPMTLDVRRAGADRPVWTSRTTREPAGLSMLCP